MAANRTANAMPEEAGTNMHNSSDVLTVAASRTHRKRDVLAAAERAHEQGCSALLVLDDKKTPDPSSVDELLAAQRETPAAFLVGCQSPGDRRQSSHSHGLRRFLAFWFRVQTGLPISDVESGPRIYPVRSLLALNVWSTGFAFDDEVLVRAVWAGAPVREVHIAGASSRQRRWRAPLTALCEVGSLTILNTHLTLRSILPWPHHKLHDDPSQQTKLTIIHPFQSLRKLIMENTSPREIALAVGTGVFLGVLPLIFVHTISIIFAANFFRLNKPTAIMASQVCMPPLVPALCIEVGHLMRHGRFLTELSLNTLGYQAVDRLIEWFLGSLILAPLLAVALAFAAYVAAQTIRKRIPQKSAS